MSGTTQARPKAFAIWFKDLQQWSVGGFIRTEWNWPPEIVKPLLLALKRKVKELDKSQQAREEIRLATLHFDGTIEPRAVRGMKGFKGKLFVAEPGDVIYSKIDVRNGAIGIVPEEMAQIAVSSEFPVYEVLPDVADPHYIKLLFQTQRFRQIINGMISGTSGRKRAQPAQLENVEVPLPSLETQQAIVAHWQQAQDEVRIRIEVLKEQEKAIPLQIYDLLVSPSSVPNGKQIKCMALWWKDLERWSFNYLARFRRGLIGFTESEYPIVPLRECLIDTMNGYCIKPVAKPTRYRMLKLNALAPEGLDLEASKYIEVPDRIAERFSLHAGDLLMCRSVGSYEHVAKCALVRTNEPHILFPDIMICIRFNKKVLPEYVREIIQTPLGRSYFKSNARTAVGMWKIGSEDINSFPLPLPPIKTQREIIRRVQERRAEIAREREAAERRAREAVAEVEALILGTKKIAALA